MITLLPATLVEPCAIVTSWPTGDLFVNSTVTFPGFAWSCCLSYASWPVGSAASAMVVGVAAPGDGPPGGAPALRPGGAGALPPAGPGTPGGGLASPLAAFSCLAGVPAVAIAVAAAA